MAAQLCEYTRKHQIVHFINGWILWYVKCISINLLKKKGGVEEKCMYDILEYATSKLRADPNQAKAKGASVFSVTQYAF